MPAKISGGIESLPYILDTENLPDSCKRLYLYMLSKKGKKGIEDVIISYDELDNFYKEVKAYEDLRIKDINAGNDSHIKRKISFRKSGVWPLLKSFVNDSDKITHSEVEDMISRANN